MLSQTPPSPARRVCIVSHHAYGAMTGGRDGHAGGVERQTTMLARWLGGRGLQVSLVVWNEGQSKEVEIDGVHVIAICRRDAGTPGLRFFHPRWTSLVAALARADAELYYHNCAEYVTGQVALWCRLHGRRFVYSSASDPDCDPSLPALRHHRERLLYRYGLRHADRIIVQHEGQRRMLRDGWGLEAMVLPMPCAGPGPQQYRPPDPWRRDRPRVVWVGRISREKRLDRLLGIAADMPDVDFEVAGAPADGDGSGHALVARAGAEPNIRCLGKVSREDMPLVYADAACLLCTSDFEGFPNTFLEAWSHGVPVVSTVDPDGLVVRHGLGGVATSVAGQVSALRALLGRRDDWLAASSRARAHYLRHHTPEHVLPRFERVFRELLDGPGQRDGAAEAAAVAAREMPRR
jgi:glycosyltransferase involved in cell wall biosynthesis